MTKIEYARYYRALLKWSIIPIISNSKRPATSWKEFQLNPCGLAQIEKWWGSKRDAEEGELVDSTFNLGLVTGKTSGIIVVDEDSYKEAFKELTISSPLFVTTPKGGRHLYFKYTEGINNTVNQDIAIDIRGEGGYVLLPPSTIDRKFYKWNTKPTKEILDKLPTLPQNIVDYINKASADGQQKQYHISDSIGVSEGARDISLYKGIVSILNRMDKSEWDTKGFRMAMAINNTYTPPLDEKTVREKFLSAVRFVHNNPVTTTWKKSYTPQAEQRSLPMPRSIADVAAEREAEKQLELSAPSTGYKELDQIVRGFLPGHLYTLTGIENIGKTSIACNFAVRVAKQGCKVLYFALEPENTVVDYLASVRFDKRFADLTGEDITYDDGNIHVYGKDQISKVDDLVRIIQELDRYDLVIIDHIGYFVTGENNFVMEQSNVIKRLAGLSKSKKCSIMMIAHLRKRSPGQKKDYVPSSDDISGSGAFKQDSTEVMIVTRKLHESTEGMEFTNEGDLYVTKTKAGPNGSMKLYFSNNKANILSMDEVFRKVKKIE